MGNTNELGSWGTDMLKLRCRYQRAKAVQLIYVGYREYDRRHTILLSERSTPD